MNLLRRPSFGVRFACIRALLVVCVVLLSSTYAQTSTGSLSGKVTDHSNAPLSGAVVMLADGTSTTTDRDGDFSFGVVSAGAHTLQVSYLGQPTKEVAATIVAGEPRVLNVKLGDETVQLATFTVEGQRAGQARALNQQRASGNLRSVVAADAIGRFPDQNAAETLQRITGVSLERDQGEGRFISIRGVDPDLNNTQLNGVNIPASQEDSRKVNLDVFPTDILDSIEVVKAITPDMDGSAIGGSVNIKTQTAFSADGRILRGSIEGQYNDLIEKWGYKYSAVWGDKFFDGKLGLLLSWSAAKRQFGSNGRETDDNPWVTKGGAIVPGADIQHREYSVTRWRSGGSFSLDFRPEASDSYYVRGVYSRFSDYENRFRTRFRGSPANTTPTSDTAGSVVNSRIQVDLKDRYEDNKVWSFSAGGEHQRGDWTVDYQAAYSLAKLIDPFRVQPAFRTAATSYSYELSDLERPVFTGAGVALAPSAYSFNGWALDRGFNDEDEWTFAGNAKRQFRLGNHTANLKFGAKYRMKARTVNVSSDAVILAPGTTLTLADFARFSSRGAAATLPSISPAAFRAFYAANPGRFTTDVEDTRINETLEDYENDENILAGYAMADVTFGKLMLLGGVRVEQTDFETRGWSLTDGDAATLTRVGAGRDYTTVLPGVVARYDFSRRLIARASATTTLARPKPLDASASREIDSTTGDVSQGNPDLKPYQAHNFDASLEFYPQSLGVFSVGVFHKDIRDFVYAEVVPGGGISGGTLSTPLNGDSATITGLEAEWQQQFTGLPSPFDGLGLFANFTLTDSEATLGGTRRGEAVPFLNQSKRISNLALSYEKYGFFIRASLNTRSRYLSLLGASTAGDQYIEDHTQLDISTNYKISPRFTIYAELCNATKEPYLAVYNVTGGLRKAEYYSWSANAGLKFNF